MVRCDVVSFGVVAGLDVNHGDDRRREGMVEFVFDGVGDVVAILDGQSWRNRYRCCDP
jgi:hypothetical protein